MPARRKSTAELRLLERVDDLLDEVHRLQGQVADAEQRAATVDEGEESGLALLLPEQEARLVEFAESALVRALSVSEAYFLGQMVQAYGPQRCLWALERKRASKQIVRAAYAMLNNGARGNAAKPKEVAVAPAPRWWTPPEDYHAHD